MPCIDPTEEKLPLYSLLQVNGRTFCDKWCLKKDLRVSALSLKLRPTNAMPSIGEPWLCYSPVGVRVSGILFSKRCAKDARRLRGGKDLHWKSYLLVRHWLTS